MAAAAQSASTKPRRGSARLALLNATIGLVRKQGWSATSVDQLCAAAARHWSDVTGPLFAKADYHQHVDPLDRIFGYIDFRAAIAKGPLEAFTCFAGTTVQEVFATSDPMRVACGASIEAHADKLAEDFRSAIALHPPRLPVTDESLAIYTQTVLQGGFVMAKARGDRAPLLEALAPLKNYLTLIFNKETLQ